ncbi:helix-turn-helix domain-containing protein [Enterococcus italicus]|uniref:helix-turn-helix domain-containing protein n=1 Tax=Enterococcus italicus TaxID=246144 RepID=UPI002074129A|nr:helix-turn-helix transcriptional regulator [Enterococcus italicus]MCM6930303.1 helix-turn-helix domain-containing protein [Enterococcus italicus]
MTAFDRLKFLCEKQGISVNDLEEKIDIGKNSLYSWKKNIPKGTNLLKVADYFHVSTDYLLGRTDSPNGYADSPLQLTVEEALASVMSSDGKPLTDHDREVLTGIIEAYIEKNSDK